MRKVLMAFTVVLMVLGVMTAPAAAYEFPSTNEANKLDGGPYVYLVASGPGWIELEFVDPDLTAKYELRADGEWPEGRTCREHQVIMDECTYPGWEVEPAPGEFTETGFFAVNDGWLNPQNTIEVRKAGGAERDTDFDWVTFDIPALTKADCKDGGYATLFPNQGQCIQFVNTGM